MECSITVCFFICDPKVGGVKIEYVATNRKSDSASLSVDRHCREILILLQLNCSKKNLIKQ